MSSSGCSASGIFGFGAAVCAPVIEWIVSYYLDPLVNELLRGGVMRREG